MATSIFRILFAPIFLLVVIITGIALDKSLLEKDKTIFHRVKMPTALRGVLIIFSSKDRITTFLILYQVLVVYPTLIMVCIAIITEVGIVSLLPMRLQGILQIVNRNRIYAGALGGPVVMLWVLDFIIVKIFKLGYKVVK
jgi:hypothetical protein